MFLRNREDALTDRKNDLIKKNVTHFNELGIKHCLVKKIEINSTEGSCFLKGYYNEI